MSASVLILTGVESGLLVAIYTIGAASAFVGTAYARALNWSVPRFAFVLWPLIVLAVPVLVLHRAHEALERYFALGLREDRKRTKRIDVSGVRRD